MKTVIGFKYSLEELLSGRGLGLDTTPEWVSRSAEAVFGERMDIVPYVQRIIDGVKSEGDSFLRSVTHQIEDIPLQQIEVDKESIRNAYERIDKDLRLSLEVSASRVKEFK